MKSLAHIPFVFKRSSKRKTLGMKIMNGEVIVSYPMHASRAELDKWIASQEQWILKYYKKPAPLQAFKPSDVFYWMGQKIVMQDILGSHHGLVLPSCLFELPIAEQAYFLRGACALAAEKDLPPRVLHFQEKLGLYACSVKLRAYKSRWGSCSSQGELTFNTLLMMAPDWVRDYVVVHELCHLKHLNHSAQFWAEVGRIFDRVEVRNAKNWLKQRTPQMQLIYR